MRESAVVAHHRRAGRRRSAARTSGDARGPGTRAACLGACVALLAMLLASPASAAQQQNAHAYAYWNLSNGGAIWNVDQNLQVREAGASTFWAGYWQWSSSEAGIGGYFGLQKDGNRFDATTGDTAIFSVWNADDAHGPGCGAFGGEGTGYSCRLAYPIASDRMYRLRLWRVATEPAGQWWSAWVMDQTTGTEAWIGEIRAPASATAVSSYMNFTEYFGESVAAIDQVPRSITDFTQPGANQISPGVYQAVGSFTQSAVGSGTTGSVEVVNLGWTNAARITMGGTIVTDPVVPPVPPVPLPVSPDPATKPTPSVPAGNAAGRSPVAAVSKSKCLVPKLVGKTVGGARQRLNTTNCALGKVKWAKGSRSAKRARISSQNPRRGTVLRAGAKVSVVVRAVKSTA